MLNNSYKLIKISTYIDFVGDVGHSFWWVTGLEGKVECKNLICKQWFIDANESHDFQRVKYSTRCIFYMGRA